MMQPASLLQAAGPMATPEDEAEKNEECGEEEIVADLIGMGGGGVMLLIPREAERKMPHAV